MNPTIRNSIAMMGGLILGSAVNMALITLGAVLVPPPTGADTSSIEAMIESMALYEAKHFLFPFLAHSLGTLVGAIFAAKVAATHQLTMAVAVGLVFLAGGIYMVLLLPSPIWFSTLDLVAAYLPMSYLGYKLVTKNR